MYEKLKSWITLHPRTVQWAGWIFGVLMLASTFASCAHAADLQWTWTVPAQYTDGTPLPASAIVSYDIEYGLCSADKKSFTGTPVIVNVPAPATSKTITGVGAGIWCGSVRTNTADAQSVFPVDQTTGQLAWKQIVLTPKPPGNISVGGGGGIAYMAVRQQDRFVMIPVGTVPANTQCDPSNGVLSGGDAYFAVPASSVSWYGSTRPTVVLSTCS
jgi:hypothetical protein